VPKVWKQIQIEVSAVAEIRKRVRRRMGRGRRVARPNEPADNSDGDIGVELSIPLRMVPYYQTVIDLTQFFGCMGQV